MTRRLEGRSAVVTGAGSGIGAVTAAAMAAEGARVTLVDLAFDRAREAAEEIMSAGGEAQAIACDVTDVEQVVAAFNAATASYGLPDVLFNNAGISGPWVPAPDTPLEEFDRCIAVNGRGVFVWFLDTPPARATAARAHAVGRVAEPPEIATAVIFLCSCESSFVTGIPLIVDGGVSAGYRALPEHESEIGVNG